MKPKHPKIPWGRWVCTLLRYLSIDCRRVQGPYVPYRDTAASISHHPLH